MSESPPFSSRISISRWVKNDFPKTARNGLLYLLTDLVEQSFVSGWPAIDKELRRIARAEFINYNPNSFQDVNEASDSAHNFIYQLSWDKIFNFCERLHSYLAIEPAFWNEEFDEYEVTTPLNEVQRYITNELHRLFLEENLAYFFDQGQVKRRSRGHTIKQIEKLEAIQEDPRLHEALRHYEKALHCFHKYSKPDFENTVKEAVCAIESAARRLFPHVKAKTLSEVIHHIQGPQSGQIPKALAKTIDGLYAYRNSGDGVSHGGAAGGKATSNIAEYSLSLAASQIIFLHELASDAEAEANNPL